MHIVLIGYRGSGKSAVGRRLAERLRMPFYDTDDLVKIKTGRSIRAIVEERGWPYFRRIECEVIEELAALQDGVIATGGGAVLEEGNCRILKRRGLVIWLAADVATMVHRMREDVRDEEQRPPLSRDNMLREAEEVLGQRTPIYRRLADSCVDTAGKNIDEIVDEVSHFLEEMRSGKKEATCREIP